MRTRAVALALLALSGAAACRGPRASRSADDARAEPAAREGEPPPGEAPPEEAPAEGARREYMLEDFGEEEPDDAAGDAAQEPADAPAPAPAQEPPQETPQEPAPDAPAEPAAAEPDAPPVADAPQWEAAPAREAASARPISGYVRSRYRYRATPDENDHDVETEIALDVLDAESSPVSGHVVLWTNADLDEAGSSSEPDPFFDLSDTWDSSFTARLYEAYVDAGNAADLGVLRVGRQPLDETPEFVLFDGVRAETEESGERAWRLGAYGGVPTHVFESSPDGDRVFGTFAEARPWRGGRARLDWMHLEDDDLLGEHRNDLLAASAWHTEGRLRLNGAYSWLEGESRDLAARAVWHDAESDLVLQGAYYQLLETQRDLATEVDPFFEALAEYSPFVRADVALAKGIGERWRVELGSEIRQLVDESDEAEFNHEYLRHHAGVELDRIADTPLTASLTGELWDSDDGGFAAWSADLTREWEERLRTSIGSYFALYDFDLFTLDEREDVRVYYLEVRYELSESTRLELAYEFENDELTEYHSLRGGVLWRF